MTKEKKHLVRKLYHMDIDLSEYKESPVKTWVKAHWLDLKTMFYITFTALVFAYVMTNLIPLVVFKILGG